MEDVIRKAMAEVRAVYSELETRRESRACIGRTTCCRFLLTGKTPMLTAGEALAAAAGVRASGRKQIPEAGGAEGEGTCPLLGKNGKCTIYADRPFGCRTHFCDAAGGTYSRGKLRDLIQRLEAVGEMLGEVDVRPLEAAVGEAMGKVQARRRGGRAR